jgi:hypothetical protein
MCLETLFASATGGARALQARQLGKPSRETGECARALLMAQCDVSRRDTSRPDVAGEDVEIWTVGDNPLSDVALAHTMGWNSALVRTGVWDGTSAPEVRPAACLACHICAGIGQLDAERCLAGKRKRRASSALASLHMTQHAPRSMTTMATTPQVEPTVRVDSFSALLDVLLADKGQAEGA